MALILAFVCALMIAAGSAAIALRASAALQEIGESGNPGQLVLRSDPGSPRWTNLRPGDSVHWLIEASLADVDESTLSVQLLADGTLVDVGAMTVSVESCTAPFQEIGASIAPRCVGTADSVLANTPLAVVAIDGADEVYELADLHRGTPRHLLVSLSVASSAEPVVMADATARIGVGLHAAGASPQRQNDALAITGANPLVDIVPLVLLGGGLIGLGLSVALWQRARSAPMATPTDAGTCS